VIVVAGESLIDLVVRADGSVVATPGGGPYNVARALGRLGASVAFLGRVSNDRFGRILEAGLAADGVDLDCLVRTDEPTMLAVAEVDDAGAATYRFHAERTAAAGLLPEDVPNGLPAGTTAFHVGTLGLVFEPTAATIEGLAIAASPDVLVMLDPNCRPAAIADPHAYQARLDRVLVRVDVVKASADDLAWLDPERDAVAAARRLLARGPAVVLLTDGPNPVRIVTRRSVTTLEVPRVVIVDTIGAGDAFGAGFLEAWMRDGHGRPELADGAAVVEATRFAIKVGSRTTARAGAEPPTLAELDAVERR
jgi:fructokinase